MENKNPWLGLASYEVPQEGNSYYKFCGRDEETMDVVRLVDNNLFITLYGSSGIGKTSLLKAGVIPILKRKGYFPLYVRLSQEPADISYAEAIVKHLASSGLREERMVQPKHTDGGDRLYLWEYFATTRLINSDGNEVYPVIILDQFEEVFRDADKNKAELLLKQMYLLLNDELEMPDEEGYSADTNYRFVASIREDFLFVLEDSIDAFGLDLYKSNRYRLRAMKPENARQVVLVPGRDCIAESQKENIADKIVALAKNKGQDSIDTLLLSLICAEVYNNAVRLKQDVITSSVIEQIGDNILSSFYERTIKTVSPVTEEYVETHLLTQSGFRNSVAIEDMLHDGVRKDDLRKLQDYRLIKIETINGIARAEFTHDAICSVAKVYRDKKIKISNRKSEKSRNKGFVLDIALLLLFSINTVINSNSLMVLGDTGLNLFYLPIILISSLLFLPYRHTNERNSLWFCLMTLMIVFFMTDLIIGSQLKMYMNKIVNMYLEILPNIYSDIESYGVVSQYLLKNVNQYSVLRVVLVIGTDLMWSVYGIYIFIHTLISRKFKKTRTFKEALKYVFTFQIYKEHPKFKKILLIEVLAILVLFAPFFYLIFS